MGPNDSGTAPISPDEDITMNHSDEANVEGGSGAADIDLSDEANFMEGMLSALQIAWYSI